MSNIKALLAIDKLQRLGQMIKQCGGVRNTMYKIWRFDTLKDGRLVGWDAFGNKYYENDLYFTIRNRWVEYADTVKWDYEGSQITPEWYGWIHHKTDRKPCEDIRKRKCYKWLAPHSDNRSGTRCAYYPYSTVPPRICIWDGSCVCRFDWPKRAK